MAADTTRVFKSSKTAKAGLLLEEDAATLIGDQRHFLNADSRGVTIRGPMSLVCTSESIRRAGLFIGMNDYIEQLPSTIVSPLPKNIPYPPAHMMVDIVKDLAFFMAFLV